MPIFFLSCILLISFSTSTHTAEKQTNKRVQRSAPIAIPRRPATTDSGDYILSPKEAAKHKRRQSMLSAMIASLTLNLPLKKGPESMMFGFSSDEEDTACVQAQAKARLNPDTGLFPGQHRETLTASSASSSTIESGSLDNSFGSCGQSAKFFSDSL